MLREAGADLPLPAPFLAVKDRYAPVAIENEDRANTASPHIPPGDPLLRADECTDEALAPYRMQYQPDRKHFTAIKELLLFAAPQ